MTRKHFNAIAAAIKAMQGQTDRAALLFMANRMADTFKTLNPEFNRTRFLDACGF